MKMEALVLIVVGICYLSLTIMLTGCEAMVAEMDKPYHEYAWYQEGKTIVQARRDCDVCIYEVGKAAYPSSTLFQQCMSLRGYQLYKAADLTVKQMSIQEVKGWNAYWIYNDVAGLK